MIKFLKSSIAGVICLALCLCSFSGCARKVSYTPADIVNTVMETQSLDNLTELTGDKLSAYFVFKVTDVKRFSARVSVSDESADTLASFEYDSTAGRDAIIAGITQYVSKLSASYKNTLEHEYQKVCARVLVQLGNTVTLVICSDSASAGKQLEQMGAKPIS